MATYRGDYQSDLGRDFWAVSLTTRFVVGDGPIVFPNESALLPPSFVAWVDVAPGPCSLKLNPRMARLWLSDLLQFDFPIPWRGGSAEFSALLTELDQIAGIQRWEILPEQISPAQCRLQLRV
jgi:hypothetical protein